MVSIRELLGSIAYIAEAHIDTLKATEKFVSGMVNPLTGEKFKSSEQAVTEMTKVMVKIISELQKAK